MHELERKADVHLNCLSNYKFHTTHTHVHTHTHLIVVASKVRDESNMFRSDDLHTRLNGHCHLLLGRVTGAGPLGGVVMGQLANPIGKTNRNISIESGHRKVLYVCVYVCVDRERWSTMHHEL